MLSIESLRVNPILQIRFKGVTVHFIEYVPVGKEFLSKLRFLIYLSD